jgi:hypothetical protein
LWFQLFGNLGVLADGTLVSGLEVGIIDRQNMKKKKTKAILVLDDNNPSESANTLPTVAKTPSEATETASGLTECQEKLLDNLSVYKSWYEAAKAAGYSEKTARNIKSLMKRSPKFLDRFRQRFKAGSTLRLAKVEVLEEDALDIAIEALQEAKKEKDAAKRELKQARAVRILSKLKHISKEIKQQEGILAPDSGPVQQTINIGALQNLMLAKHKKRSD